MHLKSTAQLCILLGKTANRKGGVRKRDLIQIIEVEQKHRSGFSERRVYSASTAASFAVSLFGAFHHYGFVIQSWEIILETTCNACLQPHNLAYFFVFPADTSRERILSEKVFLKSVRCSSP